MKTALVLGANGYLGRHMAQSLLDAGYDVACAGRQEKSIDGHKNYHSLDFANKGQIEALDFNVDFIFFFAGLTGTGAGFDEYEAYVQSNVLALLHVLDHHRKSKSRARIIFPSSRLVYQGQEGAIQKEDAPKLAKTIYAQNKLAAEGILRLYQNRFGIPYNIFRICVPYGNRFDDSYSYGTIGFFLGKARKGENIPVFGEGSQRRTFTHVADITAAILAVISNAESINTTFNVGGGNHLSLAKAAKLVADKFKVGVDFAKWPEEALLLESGDTVFNSSKLDNLCAFQYKHSLESWLEGLKPAS